MSKRACNKGLSLGIRHLQVVLILLAIFVQFIVRFCASISVVAMTNSCTSNQSHVEYKWNNVEISNILGGFFWGSTITQFPGSYLCRVYGVKLILLISVFGSSLFALATPSCIPLGGWKIFCAIRIMQGLFQGLSYPCIHDHLAKWAPVEERNLLGAIALSGQELGALVAMFGGGVIASSSLGWPGIFYLSGGVGIVWCFLWLLFASNSPLESKWISSKEKIYILASLDKTEVETNIRRIPVPWKAIWSSLPFWALLVTVCAESFGFTTLEAQIPSYVNGVLDMNINSNGIYSSLPYLSLWIMGFVYLLISIFLLKKKYLSLTILRRSFNTMALWIPAAGFVGIGFLDKEHRAYVIIVLTIMMGFHSGTTIGSSLNTLDLSPNHAGMLVGIINSTANAFGIISPLTVGWIVLDQHERGQWQVVFIISAMVFFIGNLFYITCGSTKVQPWNDRDYFRQTSKIFSKNPSVEP